MSASITPEWLTDLVQDTRRLLGIGDDWHVFVEMKHMSESNGSTQADSVYLNADLCFSTKLAPGELSRQVVAHELLHVAHQEIDSVVERMCVCPLVRVMYDEAVERFCQRITRALASQVRPKETA